MDVFYGQPLFLIASSQQHNAQKELKEKTLIEFGQKCHSFLTKCIGSGEFLGSYHSKDHYVCKVCRILIKLSRFILLSFLNIVECFDYFYSFKTPGMEPFRYNPSHHLKKHASMSTLCATQESICERIQIYILEYYLK